MNAADLKVFEAVARLGGMGRAAEALHTVQSNVTARIRRLEQELGTPLFRRHARGVEPTPAGLRLLPYALRAARLLEEARRAALDDGTPAGPLVVGSLETTAALHLTPVLTAFAAAHPAVDLTLGLSRDWGSRRDSRWRMWIVGGLEALPEAGAERAVVDGTTNLQQQVGAAPGPAHLLRLGHASVD